MQLPVRPTLAGLAVLIAAHPADALDAGLPLTRSDVDAVLTLDVLSETMDRDIVQAYAFTDGTFKASQEENRALVRATAYPGKRLTVHGVFGVTNSEESEGVAPLVGGGVAWTFWRRAPLRLDAFVGGTYVHDIDYRRSPALTPIAEIAGTVREESYYEIGGGLRASAMFDLGPTLQLLPYAGVAASTMQAEGEERIRFLLSGESKEDPDVDFEDDSPVSVFVGAALLAHRNYGLRVEGRFIGQTTFSAGLFFSF